jgi:hypothetical protein
MKAAPPDMQNMQAKTCTVVDEVGVGLKQQQKLPLPQKKQ